MRLGLYRGVGGRSPRRHTLFQLLIPVEHYIQAPRTRLVLHHHESLAVWADVVIGNANREKGAATRVPDAIAMTRSDYSDRDAGR
jgi:hypothetical protein